MQQALLMPWEVIVDLMVEQESKSGRRGSTHSLMKPLGSRAPLAVATKTGPPPRSSYVHLPYDSKFHKEQSQARQPCNTGRPLFGITC